MLLTRRRTLSLLVAAPLVAAACRKKGIRVGSKNFSESVLLGEIVKQQIAKATGLAVEHKANLGGSFICHQAMLAGDLDCYVEYTGTALVAILKDDSKPPLTDPDAVRREVARVYADKYAIVWLPVFGFDDTFAILVRKVDAQKWGITKASELAAHQGEIRTGFGYEFVKRSDGYEAFVKAYGLAFKDPPMTMELGLTYRALSEGKVDLIAGNSTSALIDKLGLVQLEDDRRFFPPYEAAPLLRKKIADDHPELVSALSALGGKFSTAKMRALNQAIDVDGRAADDVAREFLASL